MSSPYADYPRERWLAITKKLISRHPIPQDQLVELVLRSWEAILKSRVGDLTLGTDLRPVPQIMAFFLHEVIGHFVAEAFPQQFATGRGKVQKDIHCLSDEQFSIEIKASSNPTKIFGNRSYAQPATEGTRKNKDGYFLTVNFEKFPESGAKPRILRISFGYLEHTDWSGQAAQTGQQASLSPATYRDKLIVIYEANSSSLNNAGLLA